MRREEVSTAKRLEQSGDISLVIDVNQLRRGSCRQTWHSHDISRNGNQETSTRGNFDLAYGHVESGRTANQLGVIGQ